MKNLYSRIQELTEAKAEETFKKTKPRKIIIKLLKTSDKGKKPFKVARKGVGGIDYRQKSKIKSDRKLATRNYARQDTLERVFQAWKRKGRSELCKKATDQWPSRTETLTSLKMSTHWMEQHMTMIRTDPKRGSSGNAKLV